MKEAHIELLKCISCKGSLRLSNVFPYKSKDGKIESGVLSCPSCKANYPIVNGVGVFFLPSLQKHYLNQNETEICKNMGLDIREAEKLDGIAGKQLDVAKKWSYQWNDMFAYLPRDLEKQDLYGKDSFFKFIPIEPSDLKGKIIVVWCGGRGREAYHLAKYKPDLLIVNEIGDQIYEIPDMLPDDVEILLIRSDMIFNPLADKLADYSICDHALQHVADHKMGFKKLAAVLKEGGVAAINVYSYENNFLMTHFIEPLKHILHKLSIDGQRRVSLIPAALIYFLIHLVYIPMGKLLGKTSRKIFLYEYMIFRSKDSFKSVWVSCFDLIHAPISYHFNRKEILNLAGDNDVSIKRLILTNDTTWSMVGARNYRSDKDV